MKRVAVIALTRQGSKLGIRLLQNPPQNLHPNSRFEVEEMVLFLPEKFGAGEEIFCGTAGSGTVRRQVRLYDQPLSGLVGSLIQMFDGFVFIMAAGIVVRLMARHIKDKRTDPAVVVVDEAGRFAISLLSGHLGGANALARQVAAALGAQEVITTATDVQGVLAMDLAARDLNLAVEPFANLRRINAAIVNGEEVGIFSEVDLSHNLPGNDLPGNIKLFPFEAFWSWKELSSGERTASGGKERTQAAWLPAANPPGWLPPAGLEAVVLVTNKKMEMDIERITRPFLFLRPRNLIAGIGCRRGTAAGTILAAVGLALARAGLAAASLKMLASIDVKSAEKGLIQAAQRLGIPLKLFSAREIQGLEGQFAVSEFVKKTVGVGAVCEPVAMLAGGNRTRLVLPKIVHQGVTVAVAEESCP